MDKLNLSVMIPAYKASTTVTNAVKSALRNLPEHSEVLVYLDGPDEQASQILSTIKDKRLSVIQGEKNLGVYHARNELLKASRGKYVANLDADDICLPNRFNKQLKYLQNSNDDIVFMNPIFYKPENKLIKLIPGPPISIPADVARVALAHYSPFNNSTMFALKSTLIEIGDFENCPSEDYFYWLKAQGAGFKLSKSKSYGILYRVHKNQQTASEEWRSRVEINNELITARNLLIDTLIDEGLIQNGTKTEILSSIFSMQPSMKLEILGTIKYPIHLITNLFIRK